MSSPSRSIRLLAGIGLVIVGLLSGVLLMMIMGDGPERPSVVRVMTKEPTPSDSTPQSVTAVDSGARRGAPTPATLNRMFRTAAEEVTGAVVSLRVEDGEGGGEASGPFGPSQNLGSGVLISPDGYIVTNNHVVEGARTVRVTLADKRQFDAEVIGTDSSTDLAVIQIDGDSDFPALALGASDGVEVGDWVVAVGNPFRLTSTVTAGIVSALGRQIGIIEDQFRVENFIQTDAAINPGNSGGALVNLQGELVGINTAIASGTGGYEGYGFAIPSALVERVVTDLIAHGEVRRGYLGVGIRDVNAEMASDAGLDEVRGVYVDDVRDGGSAAESGVRSGDIILAVQGEAVDGTGDLQSIVALQRPGDVVSVRVWRNGEPRMFDVQLMGENTSAYQNWLSDLQSDPQPDSRPDSERPEDDQDESDEDVQSIDAWGVGLRPVGEAETDRFEVESGAVVAYVEQGGAAAEAGLPRDVVITALDDTRITGPDDVQSYLETADTETVLVQVLRSDGTQAFYEIDSPRGATP
ncbi:MAG: trypsin-like peptidase domain-containing protein [Salinivenus sp.]